MNNIGRNAPCPCGSGQKYKKCCLEKEQFSGLKKQEPGLGINTKQQGILSNLSDSIVNVLGKWCGESDEKVKCNFCDREFERSSKNAFESIKKEGKRIYFCPECNINLSCTKCMKKLGNQSFNLYSCKECGGIMVICDKCGRKQTELPTHAEGHHK